MPVSHVGSTTAGANTATIAFTWPAGTASGDVAYIFWTMINSVTPNVPTGFTQVAANDVTSGSSRLRIYRKVLTATESGTLTLSNTTAFINRQSACLVVYRGVDNTTPEDSPPSHGTAVSGTTVTPPSETTTVANCVLVTSVHERATSITTNWTQPTGYAERADTLTLATGSGGTITAVADDLAAKAIGTYTPGAWTSNSATASANRGTYTLALREAVVASTLKEGWGWL